MENDTAVNHNPNRKPRHLGGYRSIRVPEAVYWVIKNMADAEGRTIGGTVKYLAGQSR